MTVSQVCSAVLSLSAGSSEGSVAHQRLARVSPAVGVSVVLVVIGQVLPERGLKLGCCGEVTVGQELSRQDPIESQLFGMSIQHLTIATRRVGAVRSDFVGIERIDVLGLTFGVRCVSTALDRGGAAFDVIAI